MAPLSNFLRFLLTALTTRPPVPCCAATMHWASFR